MRRQLPLGVILYVIVVASCAGEPGMSVSIGGHLVPTVRASEVHRTACSAEVGDYAVREIPLTTVSGRPVLTLTAGAGTTGFRGAIHEVEGGKPTGTPIEEFSVDGARGSYEPRTMGVGKTYQVTINAEWSFVVTGGSETRVFRLRVGP